MKTGTIRNLGPISFLEFPVPEEGGAVVFAGPNGSGKTTAVNTIEKAVSDRGKVSVRDGAPNGEFEGLGIKLVFARSTRRVGELEVVGMESKFDVGTLVDPGVKEPEAADDKRIKALVALVGAKPDPSLFYKLVGGAEAFDRLVSPAAVTHNDLIKMAEAIKRDLEKASRTAEGEATNARARSEAAKKAAEGVDLDGPTDARAIQRELEAAVNHKATLEAQATAAANALKQADLARAALEKANAEYGGPTVDAAKQAVDSATQAVNDATEAVRAAQRALDEANHKRNAAVNERIRCEQALVAAQSYVALTASWNNQINAAASAKPVNPGDIVRAKAQVDEIREQLEQAAIIRKAQASLAEAEQLDQARKDHEARAEALRAAARGTGDVLSDIIASAGVPLKVEYVNSQARLTIETHRGRTLFAELSHGERWKIALDIAIQKIGPRGALTLDQSAWEGLDGKNRRAIVEQARAAGVLIFTAMADDGALRAEVYQNGAA